MYVVVAVKKLPANAGFIRDVGLIPGSGKSLGEGKGNSRQYSCLGNQGASPWGHKESDMTEQLSMSVCMYVSIYLPIYILNTQT